MRPKPTLADQAAEIRKKAAALGVRVRFDLEPDESTTRLTFIDKPEQRRPELADFPILKDLGIEGQRGHIAMGGLERRDERLRELEAER